MLKARGTISLAGTIGGSGSSGVRIDLMYATSFQICCCGTRVPHSGMSLLRPSAMKSKICASAFPY